MDPRSAKPHAVCLCAPSQSHIKAMLKLAKILRHRGFHITFVNMEFSHKRYLKSQAPNNSLEGFPGFRFETIAVGIPDSEQDCRSFMCQNIRKLFLAPFRELLIKLMNNNTNPPVTCIVSNGFMSTFTITAAEELGLPIALFYSISACSFMGYKKFHTLLEKGLVPLEDESCLTNGYLDTVIEWIPGKKDVIRLRDLPTFCRTTNPDDTMFNFTLKTTEAARKASAVVLLTFDALEKDVLEALSTNSPPIYTIGPLQFLLDKVPEDHLKGLGYSLWKEETECLQWLNSKATNSVVYVSFGSIVALTPEQLLEFGWGLANTKLPFLWVIRLDLVVGKSAILPPEFDPEIRDRGFLASWCPQEQVLNHPSVGGFLTHSGWNSTSESITAGVPMLCWPCLADQQTNSYYTCNEWGIGMEINNEVKRDDVEKLVKELMEGDNGMIMRTKASEWKKLAEEATAPHGSSATNLDNLVNRVLLRK